MNKHAYHPAWWLADPHLATIWGKIGRKEPPPDVYFEQWETPDGDFIELARMPAASNEASAPRMLLLHGLEGGIQSHYVKASFRECRSRGWAADLLFFRGCGREANRLPRSYHSGETSDPRFVLERLSHAFPDAPIGMFGVSLGGNVTCKLLGEAGDDLPSNLVGAVAMSTPFDLARASRHIGRGFGAVYERAFLKSLIPKAMEKIRRHAELASLEGVARARTIWEFDDSYTAPAHGFVDAADYYQRSSAISFLPGIRRPTLLLSAKDDPFLPAEVLDEVQRIAESNPSISTEFHDKGGHVGFTAGRWPWAPEYYGEWRAADFLADCFAVFQNDPHQFAGA